MPHATPRPWKVVERKGVAFGDKLSVEGPNDAYVCDMELDSCTGIGEAIQTRADAALIVRAVNERDNLIAALDDLLAGMIRCANMQNQATRDRAKEYIDRAQNTLRLAKELGK